jgi:predicted deacetylase
MIEVGKHHLTDVLGVTPKSFVAGRWSINNDTVKALIEAGITHDLFLLPPFAKPSDVVSLV